MKKIKSKGTKPEIIMAKSLWQCHIRYRKNYNKLPGKPDIVITKSKIAIFIDGEFWHGYNWEDKKQRIKSNRDYWIDKIEKNIERDKKYNEQLINLGWKVIRFWEKSVIKNTQECINQITDLVKS